MRELRDPKYKHRVNFHDENYIKRIISRQADLGNKMRYFLATGNLKSSTGLDLMQAVGFAIVAEKLNIFRYLSHFRSVHRGAYFAEMKTTKVRKLLPESWGYLCCVHTPDGAPCGLLSHLTSDCKVIGEPEDSSKVQQVLELLGMEGVGKKFTFSPKYLPVLLDGRVVGSIDPGSDLAPAQNFLGFGMILKYQYYLNIGLAEDFVRSLRVLKVKPKTGIPATMEVAFIPPTPAVFPGIFLVISKKTIDIYRDYF